MPKISSLPAATAGNLTGAAILPTTDKNTLTVGPTWAQLRTAILAQGTGYATTDVFNVGSGGIGDSLANLVLTLSGASSIASLIFQQVTARLVGGATNGLAIRNSGNTRDNLQIVDAGTSMTLTDGTNIATMGNSVSSGETTAGARYRGTGGVWLNESAGSAGSKIGIAYFDGTQNRSLLEGMNVASGFATLDQVRSGGTVKIVGSVQNAIHAVITSNQTTTAQTATNIPGLSFAIAANETWTMRCHMKIGSSAATGITFAVSVPTAATLTGDFFGVTLTNGTVAWEQVTASATLTTTSYDTLAATTTGVGAFVEAVITVINGANAGTVQVQYAKTTSGTATVYAGSSFDSFRSV